MDGDDSHHASIQNLSKIILTTEIAGIEKAYTSILIKYVISYYLLVGIIRFKPSPGRTNSWFLLKLPL
jgi:hypothetical protein